MTCIKNDEAILNLGNEDLREKLTSPGGPGGPISPFWPCSIQMDNTQLVWMTQNINCLKKQLTFIKTQKSLIKLSSAKYNRS